MRVLLVGKGEPARGGIPTFLHGLLGSDLTRRHDLELLNLTRGEDDHGGRLSWRNATRTARDAIALWRRASGQDIVHVHSALAPGVTVLRVGLLCCVARARGCHVLVHAHGGLVEHWLDRPARRTLLRAALVGGNHVLAVSSTVRRRLALTLGDERVSLVRNGVDVSVFSPAVRCHPVPRVLYVGLLTARKGVLDLFEASRLLRARGVEHDLVLVGGAPTDGPTAEAAVREAAPAWAQLAGSRERADMPAAYREADVFCLPSWWEAMPLSLLEAMASGLPVVATRVGDVPSMVEPDVSGALVPPRSPEHLADALQRILVDPARRVAWGRQGRRVAVDRFSSTSMSNELSTIYDGLGRSTT